MPNTSMVNFDFQEQLVRTIVKDGEPWFVAKDVARVLGYEWNGFKNVQHIPEEWRGVESVSTPGGTQEMFILSEPGLYFFLGRSDKPLALPFQKWIAGEVVPSIRKTGSYSLPGLETPKIPACVYPFFGRPEAAAEMAEIRKAYGKGLLTKEQINRIYFGYGFESIPAIDRTKKVHDYAIYLQALQILNNPATKYPIGVGYLASITGKTRQTIASYKNRTSYKNRRIPREGAGMILRMLFAPALETYGLLAVEIGEVIHA